MEHHPNRRGPATNAATTSTIGESRVLGTYECDEGTRQLVAQRIHGKVALTDIPTDDAGKVNLVERHLASKAELDGVVVDYLALAAALGRTPMRLDWIFEN